MIVDPTYEFERALHADGVPTIVGCDEVGRGALAGPVAVGMVVVDATVGPIPRGLRDSKMLPEPKREELAPVCRTWVMHSAVGLASAAEIDEFGIIAALGFAGERALAALRLAGAVLAGATVLLDGSHDYLSPAIRSELPVLTRIKADRDCASVSAASVIAKVHRDRLMIEHDARIPGYGWSGNKGYGSPEHIAAIGALGPCDLHRRTWLHNLAA